MLRKIYMSDFQDTISERENSITEKCQKMSEISNEDRRFLKILDTETVKIGNQMKFVLSLNDQ